MSDERNLPPAPPPPPAPPRPPDPAELRDRVIAVMRTIFDPEIPVNIYELGMVYGIDVNAEGGVTVRMTLTSPNCPAVGTLPYDVQMKVGSLDGVTSSNVDLVWDPPWNPSMMTEAARLELGMV